jgi:hypothetical protein
MGHKNPKQSLFGTSFFGASLVAERYDNGDCRTTEERNKRQPIFHFNFVHIFLPLAAADRRAKNVGIEAVVIAELKLRDIQRHVFRADFMERANHAALEDGPEAFNRVCVDRTNNVLAPAMIDRAVRKFIQIIAINRSLIGCQQTDLIRNCFVHKLDHALRIDTLDNASNHIALATDCANDRSFSAKVSLLFVPMPIGVLTADVSLIHFDYAAEFGFRLHQRRANFVAHAVRRLIAAKAHLPLDLQRRNSFFAGQHKVSDLEPIAKRLVCVLKNGARNDRKAVAGITSRSALRALPMPLAGMKVIDRRIAATRAVNAVGPAAGLQIGAARIVVTDWEAGFKLAFRHLMDWFGTFCHGAYPCTSTVGAYCHG